MISVNAVLKSNKFIYSNNEISNNLDLNFKLQTEPLVCFNHSSIILNFLNLNFGNKYIIKKSDKVENINRNHDLQNRIKNIIIDNPEKLEDYDNLEKIKTAFTDYMKNVYSHPKILHGHGEFEDGNEVNPTWIALNRFQSNRNIKPLSEALDNYKGHGVFLTLTIDHDLVDGLKDAWQKIAKRWNIFLTRLCIEKHIKRSDLNYIWVLEAQGNGYPHIHALFLGIDYLYWNGNKEAWLNDDPHSKNNKHFWKIGGVYINKTTWKNKKGEYESIRNPVNYMMKYIRKTFSPYYDDDKKLLTQAMLWAFSKRSWNTSRGIFKFLNYEPKQSVIDVELEEMITVERLKGQYTPLVWIENKIDKNNPAYKSGKIYTNSDKDLNDLAEKISLFTATKSEQRAFKYLLKYKLQGIDKSYTVYDLKADNYLHRFKKHRLNT